jgi:hypothetical protein
MLFFVFKLGGTPQTNNFQGGNDDQPPDGVHIKNIYRIRF